MKTSQKSLVMDFIISRGGLVTTNDLRDYGTSVPMADAFKRARELYKEKKLDKRWITEEEKKARNLKTDIMVYYVRESQQKLFSGVA